MNKTILIGIIITLLAISGVTAIITSQQLQSITNQQIADYLKDNLQLDTQGVDMDDEYYYWYFSTRALEQIPEQEGNYSLKQISIKTTIPFQKIDHCLENQLANYCIDALLNTDYTYINENNETITQTSVQNQLLDKGRKIYQKMKTYRNQAQRTNTFDSTGINLNNLE